MPRFSTIRSVPFTVEQMFGVVADIEKYPEFLPLCETLVITSCQKRDTETELIATMGVGYKSFREKFTTKVRLLPLRQSIFVSHMDGPFRYLDNTWLFRSVEPKKTDVHFELSYEFQSRLLSLVMGGIFDRAFRHFASSFEQRAQNIYGHV